MKWAAPPWHLISDYPVIMPGIGNFTANPYSIQPSSNFNVNALLGLNGNSVAGSSDTSVFNGYTNLVSENTSSGAVSKSKSGKKASNDVPVQPTIVSNACLAFIYSERLR